MSAPALTPASPVRCDNCEAVCCRLIVMLRPGDVVPAELTTHTATGLHVMAHRADGWCVALDAQRRCSIYANRPLTCRNFVTAAPYCRAIRIEHADRRARGIALTLY